MIPDDDGFGCWSHVAILAGKSALDMYPKCTRFVPAPVLPGMGGVLPDKKKLCKIAIFRQIYWAILGCVGSSPTSGANHNQPYKTHRFKLG